MSTGKSDNPPTIAIIPGGEVNKKSDENADYSCPRFPNKRAAQEYLNDISPPRDLICPITQELFLDPVVATGDGYTYERSDIQRWFQAQQASNGNGGDGSGSANSTTAAMIRSPVSNAFMYGENPRGLVENRVVAGLARNYREKLGMELCNRCDFIYNRITSSDESCWDGVSCHGTIGDGGFRIKSLIEAGGDLRLKACTGGNTAFMMIMKLGKIDLINLFLLHNVPVTTSNDDGQTPLDLAKNVLSKTPPTSVMVWHDVISRITKLLQAQTQKIQAQDSARTRANADHRERQRVLTATNENNRNAAWNREQQQSVVDQGTLSRGLGTLDANGQGYFPSLAALQFQGSVPEPSASFADVERRERRRLDWILRGICSIVIVYFLIA